MENLLLKLINLLSLLQNGTFENPHAPLPWKNDTTDIALEEVGPKRPKRVYFLRSFETYHAIF